jgi:hypothetical protein
VKPTWHNAELPLDLDNQAFRATKNYSLSQSDNKRTKSIFCGGNLTLMERILRGIMECNAKLHVFDYLPFFVLIKIGALVKSDNIYNCIFKAAFK